MAGVNAKPFPLLGLSALGKVYDGLHRIVQSEPGRPIRALDIGLASAWRFVMLYRHHLPRVVMEHLLPNEV